MRTLISCKNCRRIFYGEQSWHGSFVICPYCHQATFFRFYDKNNDTSIWIWIVSLTQTFILLLFAFWVTLRPDERVRDEPENISYDSSKTELSLKGQIAKYYIENELPSSQRDALMYGDGASGDKLNLFQNLLESGNLEGAIEYLQSYGK